MHTFNSLILSSFVLFLNKSIIGTWHKKTCTTYILCFWTRAVYMITPLGYCLFKSYIDVKKKMYMHTISDKCLSCWRSQIDGSYAQMPNTYIHLHPFSMFPYISCNVIYTCMITLKYMYLQPNTRHKCRRKKIKSL